MKKPVSKFAFQVRNTAALQRGAGGAGAHPAVRRRRFVFPAGAQRPQPPPLLLHALLRRYGRHSPRYVVTVHVGGFFSHKPRLMTASMIHVTTRVTPGSGGNPSRAYGQKHIQVMTTGMVHVT